MVADLTGHAFGPNWSPDGAEIAFYSTVTGSSEVLVVSADGGTPEQLTDFPGLDSWPDWSPDGLAIAFISQGPQGVGSRNTWIVSRDSVGMPWSDPVQLTDFGCRVPPLGSRRCEPGMLRDGEWEMGASVQGWRCAFALRSLDSRAAEVR